MWEQVLIVKWEDNGGRGCSVVNNILASCTIYNVLFWGLAIPAVAYLLKILGGLKIGKKNMKTFPFMQNLDFLLFYC